DTRPMAPRALETLDHFIARLREAHARGGCPEVRLGGHHYTHAVVVEGGVFRVRPLILDRAKAEAYLAEHGMFMPEHAEMLSEPGPEVVLEAGSLDALCVALRAAPWPLALRR